MGRRAISKPWQVVLADCMGPFPSSARGNEHLLIFLDAFTRWIECVPIKKKNAATIKRQLEERVFLRHGTPEIFHSDNGTEFKNRVIDLFLAERGVTHTTTPPYHAQANPVERVNRTFKTMLVSFIEGKHSTWDVHIPELMFAYNTAVQESTGMSPAFLNMGRYPAPPNTLRRCEESLAADAEGTKAAQEWRERMEPLGDI